MGNGDAKLQAQVKRKINETKPKLTVAVVSRAVKIHAVIVAIYPLYPQETVAIVYCLCCS